MYMNYDKALSILGLPRNFTEEQLKAAFRKEAKKYHPDKYSKASSEEQEKAKYKMQEVNAAYEYIIKYQKDNPNKTNNANPNNEIIELRRIMIEKLNMFLKYDINKKYDFNVEYFIFQITQIILITSSKINRSMTKMGIINEYNDAVNQIKYYFVTMKRNFYIKYNIPFTYITNLNYNCSIGNFYEQLIKVKTNYEENFKNRILQETEKYKSYNGYNELGNIIKDIINKALSKTNSNIDKVIDIKSKFNNFRNILNDKSIKNNAEYTIILEKFDILEKEYNETKDKSIMIKLRNLENEFNLLKKKIELSHNEELRECYQTIVKLYNDKLLELNAIDNFEKINLLNKYFALIMAYYKKILEGVIPLKQGLLVLKSIKFEDIIEELKMMGTNLDESLIKKSVYETSKTMHLNKNIKEINKNIINYNKIIDPDKILYKEFNTPGKSF